MDSGRLSKALWAAGIFLPGVALGVLLSVVLANHAGSGEVRVVAQRQSDGDVEVGLQLREPGGGWGERQLGANRFVPADAEPGHWLHSTPLNAGAGRFLDGRLVCLIDHGTPGDLEFWRRAHISAQEAALDFRMNLRVASGATPEAQVELIDECAADGAAVIGATLAAPDVVGPALAAARAAGVQITTFNSGSSDAAKYGSALHIGLDDPAVGATAGRAFADAGLSGVLLCVIHEADNVGLEQRCDNAAAEYGGTVERLRVDQAGLANLDQVEAMLAERLEQGGVAAVFTLNSRLVTPALAAIESSGDEVELGTIGWKISFIPPILAGDLLFAIIDHPSTQAYLAVSAIAVVGFHVAIGIDAALMLNGAEVLIEPLLYDRERVEAVAANANAMLEWAVDANDWTVLDDE